MAFLNTPSENIKQKIFTIIFAFVVVLIWNILTTKFLFWLYPAEFLFNTSPNDPELAPPARYLFFMACIWAPLWEELIFRHVPGLISRKLDIDFTLPIVLLSSAIFGWVHGNGAESIMHQGVTGLIFFWVYLKNGYSYTSSVILHMIWNFFVLFIM